MVTGKRLSRPVGIHDLRRRRVHGPLAHLGSPFSSRPRTGAIGFARPSCLRSPTPAPWDRTERDAGHPPPRPGRRRLARLTQSLDGIVFTCGTDVNPALYDAAPHEKTDPPNRGRDWFEVSLVRAATDGQLPFLAICRGMHILNVARGGTLIQHLPDIGGPRAGTRRIRYRMSPARRAPQRRQHRSGPAPRFPVPGCRPCTTRPSGRPARAWSRSPGRRPPGHPGGRTAGAPLRRRRPVAPRGRRRPAAVRSADRGGRGGHLRPGRGARGRGQGGQAASRRGGRTGRATAKARARI